MTKDQLKQFCTIKPDGDVDDDNKTVGVLNGDVMMSYKDETVLEIDFDNNYVITMQGMEHVGEHKMKAKSWEKVRVFKEVKA